ncbi:MAG: septal ring lytic transglycosylase RlpA family protein, partial [Burkholderiales bacterium]
SIRNGGPNKPYDVLGKSYVPITQDAPYSERGLASWYGKKFHGKRTASGEVYNMYAMTAAHPTLPIPSYARIRNPANGKEVVVRINDRGPFHSSRIVDLSFTAALKLDLLRGVAPVELQRITFDEIRTGAWRRDGDAAPAVQQAVRSPVVEAAASSTVVVPVVATATVSAAAPAVMPAASEPAAAVAAAPSASAPEPVADAPAARAFTMPARGFWVQLGAFRARDGAETFQQRVAAEMDWLSPLLAVFSDAAMFRLQAGPYPSRDEARGVAERVRDGLKLAPVIVERR